MIKTLMMRIYPNENQKNPSRKALRVL